MSDSSNSSSNGGIGFVGLLTILFVGLKLTHYINWSWWWVLSPLWLPMAVVLGIILIFLIGALLVVAVANLTGRGGSIEMPLFVKRWWARRALRRYQSKLGK